MRRRYYWPGDIGAKWRERWRERKRGPHERASRRFFAGLAAFFGAAFSIIFFGGH